MTENIFEKEFKKKVAKIEEIIYSYLPDESGEQKTLIEAMNYGVKVGGKRLRPLFIIETLELFGGEKSEAYPFMAAIEFIHSYSLIHDDLPSMDNAELRRGKPSVHKKFGEAMAVLAGDSLLNYAFEITSEASYKSDSFDKMKRCTKAMKFLAVKSGIYGMAGGQSVDVEKEGQGLSMETLDFIYRLKTGALIEAAMVIGAVLGNADEYEISVIEKIASDVGMAFQIMDDILDITSTNEILGKPVNADDTNNKTTYVSISGIENSKEMVKYLSDKAIENLNSLNRNNEFLSQLINSLIFRNK